MLKTNSDKLPILSVEGEVWHPRISPKGMSDINGQAYFISAIGGICYNASIGSPACGWVADHLEPGVTTRHKDNEQNAAYTGYSCIGNAATVVSGDAKGSKGFVTGKHGGCEHTMVYFPTDVIEKLNIGDKIAVRACGQGLELTDYPEILLRNVSPELLGKLNIEEEDGKIKVGVAKIVPGALMGSGVGSGIFASGDYDITMFSEEIIKEYGLGDLRLGDLVGILDSDTRFGRSFHEGAVTIGVVIHGDSRLSGHGPGVTPLFCTKTPIVEPFIDPNANLSDMFIEK